MLASMLIEDLGVLCGIVTGIVMLFIAMSHYFGKESRQLHTRLNDVDDEVHAIQILVGEFKVKVETLWDFQMRRAAGETIKTGLGTLNSPLKIDIVKAKKVIPPTLQASLQTWYGSINKRITDDRELLFEIERNFGGLILKEVCLPNQLAHGQCLLLAAAIAKRDELIVLPDGDHLNTLAADIQKQTDALT